jgi:hypothetical protein
MSVDFSAGDSALGYLYQARCALLLLWDEIEEAELSLEKLDDVVFGNAGTPYELLQLKHHSTPASLTDSSEDLWKTLRVWCTNFKDNKFSLPETILTLITTGKAQDGSIAALLRQDKNRDPKLAVNKLYTIANTSQNQRLKPAFDAFLELSQPNRELLVSSIKILDSSPNIVDTTTHIKKRIAAAVKPEYLDGLYERLEGWWFDKIIRHLNGDSNEPVARLELHYKIVDIAGYFREDSLPIDFSDKEPPDIPDANNDNRLFVIQLRELNINTKRIEKAILDYYRAFEQRSRWAREDLIFGDELEKYEKKLVDEWERFYLACLDNLSNNDNESELLKCGRKIFDWMDMEANYPIRSKVTEQFIMRGSYHILANKLPPSVWWHPQFQEKLKSLLTIVER